MPREIHYNLVGALTFWMSVPLIIANLVLAWRFHRILKARNNLASWIMFLMIISLTFSTIYKAIVVAEYFVFNTPVIEVYEEYEPIVALGIRYILTVMLYTVVSVRPKSISVRRKTDIEQELRY